MGARPASCFADNIARLFGLYRLSGSEAAQALGFSRQAVSEWQSGKQMPSLATLYAMADFFEIEPDKLMRRPFIEWVSDYVRDHEKFARIDQKLSDEKRPDQIGLPEQAIHAKIAKATQRHTTKAKPKPGTS
jgi:transcriptional regulator with XRE-family HTH domain